MIRLDVNGRFFHVEFRHLRQLPPRLGAKAITTCVITGPMPHEPWQFAAIGNTVCDARDNFSRRRGRLKAFAHALDSCGALAGDEKLALYEAYMAIDPDPLPRVPPPKLSIEEKKERWAAGWEVRQKRQARNNLRAAIATEGIERAREGGAA